MTLPFSQPASSESTNTQAITRAKVEACLQDLYAAWAARNGPELRSLFADGEVTFLGTALPERLVGRNDIDRHLDEIVDHCPPWTSMDVTDRVIAVRNGIAWVADEVTSEWEDGDEAGEVLFRITAILEEAAGEWQFVHVHTASVDY